MKNLLVIILFFIGTNVYAMEGSWTISYKLTLDANKPGQATHSSLNVKILRYHRSSGEFTGKVIYKGEYVSDIFGRVIRAEPPYKQDIVEFDRIGITKPYRAKFIGFFKNQSLITNGHFVDTYGNVGEFEMTK